MLKFLKENAIFLSSSVLLVGLVVGIAELKTITSPGKTSTGHTSSADTTNTTKLPVTYSSLSTSSSTPAPIVTNSPKKAVVKTVSPTVPVSPKVSTAPVLRYENEGGDTE